MLVGREPLIASLLAVALALPNASVTPGVAASSDPAVVCVEGYASSHRNVPYAVKDSVYDEYGIPRGHRRGWVIDHLVPLEIGGTNDERNLWPQPYAQSKQKDEVEDALHEAACFTHSITLTAAQQAIAHDWRTTPVGLPAIRKHNYEDEKSSTSP